ncbi:MAG: hypothetical protein J5802_03045 [Butyrivibrio sp.]|nr:hypothetical protein [Butyrivibrio sp.]
MSAVFSALLEPAFRATITDLLTEKEYSKASGLVSLAGSARYLFAPVIAISSVVTLFMGVFQILAEPLILSFADAKTLGIAETVCACGMLTSGMILGIRGIKRHFAAALGISLMLAGIFMFAFGMNESIGIICCLGFMFFAMLPVANNCIDYLLRTNIADEAQGHAWGLIGFLSQIGYIVAYAVSGFAADTVGITTGLGVGRGSAIVIRISGVCLAMTSVLILCIGSIRKLEKGDKKS